MIGLKLLPYQPLAIEADWEEYAKLNQPTQSNTMFISKHIVKYSFK